MKQQIVGTYKDKHTISVVSPPEGYGIVLYVYEDNELCGIITASEMRDLSRIHPVERTKFIDMHRDEQGRL